MPAACVIQCGLNPHRGTLLALLIRRTAPPCPTLPHSPYLDGVLFREQDGAGGGGINILHSRQVQHAAGGGGAAPTGRGCLRGGCCIEGKGRYTKLGRWVVAAVAAAAEALLPASIPLPCCSAISWRVQRGGVAGGAGGALQQAPATASSRRKAQALTHSAPTAVRGTHYPETSAALRTWPLLLARRRALGGSAAQAAVAVLFYFHRVCI